MKATFWFNLWAGLQAIVVLVGLIFHADVWMGIVTYWAILVVKNICEFVIEAKNRKDDEKPMKQNTSG